MSEIIRAGRTGTRWNLPDTHAGKLSKSTTKIGLLQRACLALLLEHAKRRELPTSGRFLFYELVARELVDKSATRGTGRAGRGVDQDIADALLDLRERGIVPWSWVVDETRDVSSVIVAPTIEEWVRDALQDRARIDPWDGQAPLIITESRSLRGVLAPLAEEYAADITSTNGQVGGFLVTEVAPLLADSKRPVGYLGDLDFSGGHIEDNTRDYLTRYAEGWDGEWTRLAVTDVQVRAYDLTVIRKWDQRTRSYHDAVETEALSQTVIVGLVRDWLDALLRVAGLAPLSDVLERQALERAAVLDALDEMGRD